MPRQHLTPNACLVCRKKRTKCDGQMPCRRCRSRGEECAYEDKKWRTKDHLRSEIERLRAEQRQGHALIKALTNYDPVQWETVLARMRNHDSPDDIAEWIYSMRPPPDTPRRPSQCHLDGNRVDNTPAYTASPFRAPGSLTSDISQSARFRTPSFGSLSTQSFSQSASSFDSTPRSSFSADLSSANHLPFRGRNACPPPPAPLFAASSSSDGMATPSAMSEPRSTQNPLGAPIARTWTSIVSDTRLVQRLLARFFSSPCSSLCLISQPQFLRDFQQGETRFCSESLANAILGRACKFYDTTSRLISRVTFGDAFLAESKRLLSMEQNHVNLPSIQALGILALTEISQGNDEAAWDLAWESVRASIHLMLQTRDQEEEHDADFRTVRALAYCGGFSLIRLLRLVTGRLEPNTGPLFMKLRPDSEDLGEDPPQVRVERGISLQMQFFAELQYCHPVARFVFEVTEAVHTFSSYNSSKAMTAEDLETAYETCLDYFDQFSQEFGADIDSTPDRLFSQIWYHHCLLSLLRPFVKTTASLKDGTAPRLRHGVTAQGVCRQSSEAIIFITSTYQTRYSLAQLPALLPYMVYAAVLYQLTLTTDPQYSRHQQQLLATSPTTGMPRSAVGSPRSQNSHTPRIPFAQQPPCHQPPPSPIMDMEARRVARRRASALSSVSEASVKSDQTSISDPLPDRAPPTLPETRGPGMLPLFTSEPADLVTIGSLQLASMGASHPDAAEAARLLRSLSAARDLAGANYDLASLAESLPIPMDDFSLSALLTGLGIQKGPDLPPCAAMCGVTLGPDAACSHDPPDIAQAGAVEPAAVEM